MNSQQIAKRALERYSLNDTCSLFTSDGATIFYAGSDGQVYTAIMNADVYEGLRQMSDASVERKRWYSVGDGRTRESHRDLNGTTVRFDEKFNVGGVMADGPHSTNLPAREVVNCRCRLIPVLE